MSQFTTSAKPIQYYRESTLINKFAAAVGDRCERLAQSERYQLVMCLTLYCYAYCELEEDEDPENPLEVYESTPSPIVSCNVIGCLALLRDEEPDAIAAIIPAIGEYAQGEYEDQLEDVEGSHELYDEEWVLAGLVPYLEEAER